jgi:hypothetical protein
MEGHCSSAAATRCRLLTRDTIAAHPSIDAAAANGRVPCPLLTSRPSRYHAPSQAWRSGPTDPAAPDCNSRGAIIEMDRIAGAHTYTGGG